MSGIIHFGSGKTLKISDYEMRNMPVEMASKGIKVKKRSIRGNIRHFESKDRACINILY